MSRAFVKDQDIDYAENLPDRLVSEHPNDVTETGMAQIEAALQLRPFAMTIEAVRLQDRPDVLLEGERRLRLRSRERRKQADQRGEKKAITEEAFRLKAARRQPASGRGSGGGGPT